MMARMDSAELHKLSKSELLELLLAQAEERDRLAARVEELERGLAGRHARHTETSLGEGVLATDQLQVERYRREGVARRRRLVTAVVGAVVVACAVAAILATMFFPVLRIFGTSMQPTLYEGDYAICTRTSNFETGDLVAFYYNNKLLVKRVIATGGQQVLVTAEGAVYVDGELLVEPYVSEAALGDCDLSFPYQVPEGRLFVMGDHRATSTDSRNSMVGCVSEDAIVGKLVVIVWPPARMGAVG
jgi:signal peptidase I